MNRLLKIIILITLVSALVLSGCSGLANQNTPTEEAVVEQNFVKVVSATGVVTPARKATLSYSTAGIVAEVLVEKGDVVTQGQTLILLKGREEIQASIAAANFEVLSAQQALDDLYENAAFSQAASLRMVSEASNAVRDAKYRLDNYTIPVNQQGLEAIEAMELMRERLDAAREAFEPYKNDSFLNDARKKLKENVDNAQADFNTAVRRLTYEFELAEADARLVKALKDYDVLLQGPDPDLIALAEARLVNAKAALTAAESVLNDLEIRASFDGTVSEVYTRVGEWVSPGQPVMLMADLANLRVETTDLNEIDVAQVDIDDQVIVTFDALPGIELIGEVRLIAPKASEGSGVNYTVLIEIPEIPENLRWGMTAFVDIKLSD